MYSNKKRKVWRVVVTLPCFRVGVLLGFKVFLSLVATNWKCLFTVNILGWLLPVGGRTN